MRTVRSMSGCCLIAALLLTGCGGGQKSRTNATRNSSSDAYMQQYGDTKRGVYHEVRSGETLGSISQAYNVPVDKLQQANGIQDANRLDVGFMLFIPGANESVSVKTDTPAATNRTKPTMTPGRSGPITAEANFDWPVRGSVLTRFGEKIEGSNPYQGIRIGATNGTRVATSKSGKIAWVSDGMAGYGKVVAVSHTDGYITVYGYCSEILVEQGQWVKQGDAIALTGQTGLAKTPSLYFQISKGNGEVDPQKFLK